MSIIVNEITKLYGTQKALDTVSMDIKPGEIVGLLGPNGAGKSTLMKILTCFIPPTSGDATVCGFDILEQSIDVRKKVGYLPENNPLYLDLYVKEFLRFIAEIEHREEVRSSQSAVGSFALRVTRHVSLTGKSTKKIQTRINEIIEITGLQEEQHKKIGALSKGYRQRVGLAQALLHDPEVLILDEPTSGLDPNQIIEIRALIKEISREKTIMMSTHILQEVEAICDRVIIIHKGKIVADDLTRNLHTIAKSNAVIKVEFNQMVAFKDLKEIPGVLDVQHLSPSPDPSPGREGKSGIWNLASAPDTDIRPAIFQFAVAKGVTILSLQREEQRLEEVFQELTKN